MRYCDLLVNVVDTLNELGQTNGAKAVAGLMLPITCDAIALKEAEKGSGDDDMFEGFDPEVMFGDYDYEDDADFEPMSDELAENADNDDAIDAMLTHGGAEETDPYREAVRQLFGCPDYKVAHPDREFYSVEHGDITVHDLASKIAASRAAVTEAH